MSIADILAGFLAYGLLHMRGVQGQAGWRWLFLIEVSLYLKLRMFKLTSLGTLYTSGWYCRIFPHASWPLPDSELGPRQEGLVHGKRRGDHSESCHPRRSF